MDGDELAQSPLNSMGLGLPRDRRKAQTAAVQGEAESSSRRVFPFYSCAHMPICNILSGPLSVYGE